jgi:hypothetical protein
MSELASENAHVPGLSPTANSPATDQAAAECAGQLVDRGVQVGAYRFDAIKLSSEIIREAMQAA